MGQEENVRKLSALIQDSPVAMMTTVAEDGSLISRPMVCPRIEFDGDLWFFTRKNTGKVASLSADWHVNLAYSAPEKNRYVSIAGRAQIVEDPKKAAAIWSPMYATWFPEGLEDPELALIRVHVDYVEYWDFASSKLTQLLDFVQAFTTGEPYRVHEGEHVRVDLTH